MNQYVKAYTSTDTFSGVAYADPHSLITKMFDGALKRIAQAKGEVERKDYAAKGTHISHAVAIIANLEGCLDLEKGGELAANLSSLYEYMNLRLTEANINNDISKLEEVISLILEIKSAWVQIAPHQTQKAG
jgi:flagellar secretion chaperone FliS